MFRPIQNIAESTYQNYSRNYPEITSTYFPYFKLIRNYGNYHFHFLVIRKEYRWGTLFMTEGSLFIFEFRRSRVIFLPAFLQNIYGEKDNGTEMSFLKYDII